MNFIQYASSSSGNFYVIEAANRERLLIEIGLTWDKIQKALNHNLSGINSAFVSHSHKDHFREPQKVMAAGINIFASKETFESQQLLEHRRAKVIKDKTIVQIGHAFKIRAFATNHDCVGSLGFIVHEIETKEYLLFATDTSHINQRFKLPFSIIALECSYDKDILQQRVDTGDINESVATRLLTSHTEKREAMRYLDQFCDLSKCREIHLLHLSQDNLDKDQTKMDFEKRFFIETRTIDDKRICTRINSQ